MRHIAGSTKSTIVVTGSVGATGASSRATTRHFKRHRYAHSPFELGHAPSRGLSARCSATESNLRGLARRVVLSSSQTSRPATLMGFTSLPFAGLLPHRVRGHF
jgi:hypothetical protein